MNCNECNENEGQPAKMNWMSGQSPSPLSLACVEEKNPIAWVPDVVKTPVPCAAKLATLMEVTSRSMENEIGWSTKNGPK